MVFISWSGAYAKEVAEGLSDFLEVAHQASSPFVSTALDAGAQWYEAIRSAIGRAKVGVVICTKEGLSSQWLLFEAGAMAMASEERRRVIPYCVDVDKNSLPSPLSPYQAVQADSDGTLQLLKSVNGALPAPLKDHVVTSAFGAHWTKLDAHLSGARTHEEKRTLRSAAPVAPSSSDLMQAMIRKLDTIDVAVTTMLKTQTRRDRWTGPDDPWFTESDDHEPMGSGEDINAGWAVVAEVPRSRRLVIRNRLKSKGEPPDSSK